MDIIWNNLKVWNGEVTQYDFNKLVDTCQRISLNKGVNYNLKRTPAGTTIVAHGQGGGIGPICPFTLSLTASSGASLNVTVSPGTVNGYFPTNQFDSFSIDTSGTYYAKISVTSDGQNVTSCELAVDDSEADPQNATASSLPTSFDIPLAVIKDSRPYPVLSCGSLQLTSSQAFITDKSSPAGPGELTYIPYYVWQWATV